MCLHYNKYVVSVFDRIFDRNELIHLKCCEMIVANGWILDGCVGDGCGKWVLDMVAENGAVNLCRALRSIGCGCLVFLCGKFTGYIDDCGKH